MKLRVLNACVIITSLFGYLEWGGGNTMFLFQGEREVLGKLLADPVSAAHPFTLLPLLGQALLFVTLFQKVPSRVLTYLGIGCLAVLLVFMFVIGLFSLNFKVLLSTFPFIIVSSLAVKAARQGR